jgi:anti-sigma factor RsiW
MNCPLESGANAEYLLDYAAGKLNAGMREQMALHMESCPACREFAAAQQVAWEALETWEPAPISLEFDRRLFQRIEQQPLSWWTRLSARLNPIFRHAVPIGAAAGVILVAGLLMDRPATGPAAPEPNSAQVVETLQPDQVEHALADMEMLRDFNHLVKPDSGEPKM